MDVSHSQEMGFDVITLSGNFDTASAEARERDIMDIVGDGSGKMLVDFSDVPFIASSGLRILLKVAQAVKVGNGELHLCALNDTVREVFEISGFDRIINVAGSKGDILGSG